MALKRQTSVPARIRGLFASISARAIFSIVSESARTDIGILKVPGKKISDSTSGATRRSRGYIKKHGPPGGVEASLNAFMVHSGMRLVLSTFQRHFVNSLMGPRV